MSPQMKGTLLALTGVLMFSTKSVFAKMALAITSNVISVLFLRVIIGFPIVLILTYISWVKMRGKHKEFAKDYIVVFVLAFIGYYISSLFDFSGLKYIGASVERIVLFLYPTFVIILSAFFLKHKVSVQQIVAIVICYIGLFVAFANKLNVSDSGNFWKGIFLIVVSAFTYAIFLTASNKYIPRIGSMMFTNIALLSTSISIIVHFFVVGDYSILNSTTEMYVICGLMSTIGTIIPAYIFNNAIKYLGASNVSIISSLGPIETMIMSSFVLYEQIFIIQIIGTVIVIIGVLVLKVNFSKDSIMSNYTRYFFNLLNPKFAWNLVFVNNQQKFKRLHKTLIKK